MFCAANSAFRRRRRHLATLVTIVALAGAVVAAHSVVSHDHMGDAALACLAVAATAAVALGASLAIAAGTRRRLPLLPPLPGPGGAPVSSPAGVGARASPPLLQVFRL